MRLIVLSVFCLTLIVSSQGQSAQTQASSGQASSSTSASASASSGSGSSGRFLDLFLHPLKPFLGAEGHQALHNAVRVIPMSILKQVTNVGQLFRVLAAFNPTALPQLMQSFIPGGSMLSSFLPSLGGSGLSALTSGLGSSGGLSSSPLGSLFRQNFPSSQNENGASGSSSNRGLSSLNPANFANGLIGQGMSNFAGITSSLASGQPLSALLTMAGGAADTVGRFGNLASSGLNMASQVAQTATGMASQLPGPIGQMSSTFSSMIPGASASVGGNANSGSFGASASASSGSSSGRGRGPLSSLLSNNPFTSFLSG